MNEKSHSRRTVRRGWWKAHVLRVAVISTWCGLVLGCSREGDLGGAKKYRIPWPNATGAYSLQNVPIETFDDPQNIRGKVAKILIDPYVSSGALVSTSAAPKYSKIAGDVVVPGDFATLQAVTVYAHFEKLYFLDHETGFSSVVGWPVSVGLQANVVDQSGPVLNNALYDGKLDALLLVPYIDKGVPISMNAGILAHEHFHNIFQALVLNKVRGAENLNRRHFHEWTPTVRASSPTIDFAKVAQRRSQIQSVDDVPKRVYNSYLLRGVNEGLADFWGWLYTGDSNFIGHSLPTEENELRRLDRPAERLPNDLALRLSLIDPLTDDGLVREEDRYKRAYRLGTQYARFMRELTLHLSDGEERDPQSRRVIAKALMESLASIGEAVAKAYENEFLSPNAFLKPLYLRLPSIDAKSCAMLENFAALEENSAKPKNCEVFINSNPAATPIQAPAISQGPAMSVETEVTPRPAHRGLSVPSLGEGK